MSAAAVERAMPARARGTDAEVLAVATAPLEQAPAWDHLLGDSGPALYATRAWHLANAPLMGAARTGAVLAHRTRAAAGQLAAVVPVYHYPTGPARALLDPRRLLADAGLPASAWGPITLLGSTAGYETAPICRPGHEADWLRAAAHAAAHAEGTVATVHLDEDVAGRLQTLMPEAPLVLTGARTRLLLAGTSAEDYYAHLPSRKRRLARIEESGLAAAGRRITLTGLSAPMIPTWARLQQLTEAHHGSHAPLAELTEELERYRADLAAAARVFTCWHDNAAIGYHLALRHRSTLAVRAVGLDYARCTSGEYFNLMIRAPLRHAYAHGIDEIDLGLGGTEQKLRRGGRPVWLWSLLLRPPSGWSPAHTRSHNQRHAQLLLAQMGSHLLPYEHARLSALAATGQFPSTDQ
ncbi:hypothetical protein GCM10010156_48660 [Planobispora rosea]|uniref:BioF2-like acetyltransferase domain-containing protein n=1 Tax=Planobispora rosea TaxID=35762 RepID=A0A8J3S2B1_PLARO|nr:GNAT family N-acetyltransferase [Planobispora rosea]GGS84321.1 hypothetical protein GCM10010156_48660 [Planobispora rosea]GIH86377.1 hypothetical protein Pro02_47850 [Planobispora rosea]